MVCSEPDGVTGERKAHVDLKAANSPIKIVSFNPLENKFVGYYLS